MDSSSPSWIEVLANLNTAWIIGIVVALTLMRLSLFKSKSPSMRSAAELVESFLIAIVLVYMLIRPFVVQAYFIPSASMEPTLLGKNGSGDRIIVNKMSYRFGPPQRGDVVVFIPPDSALPKLDNSSSVPVNFIKRLIAKADDSLRIYSGVCMIDGQRYSHSRLRAIFQQKGLFPDYDPNQVGVDTQADHHIKFKNDGVYLDNQLIPKDKLMSVVDMPANSSFEIHPGYTVLNGVRLNEPFVAEDPDYDLRIFNGEPLKADYSSQQESFRYKGQSITSDVYNADARQATDLVPKGRLFMMGDNRNDSDDSTEWGPLKKERVVGKAQFIFWPLDRVRPIASQQ